MKKVIGTIFLLILLSQIGWAQDSIQLGTWNSTTSLNTPRSGHTGVAYNGYLYVIGGTVDDATRFNDVQYAPINTDGSLGAWQNTTSFNMGRRSHASVVYNGYLYVIGGTPTGGGVLNDVQYAPIHADGSLGAWQSTTSFNTGRLCHASVVYNGYLYVMQGFYYSAASPLADVQFAKINADGSLGTWQTTTTFNPARWGHKSIAYNGHIYSMGGSNWNGSYYTLNDVQYSSINSNGSLNNWQSTTSLNPSLDTPGLVEYNGYFIITGGISIPNGFVNNVKCVKINSNGSLGSWQNMTSFNTARAGHVSAVYGGYLYVVGGQDNNGNALNDVQYANINVLSVAPQNLTAIAGDGQVTLKWNKVTEQNFLRYRIYCGTSPNPTVRIDSTTGGISDTTKIITGLTNGTTYYFRVTAVDNSGNESGYSNEVSAVPLNNSQVQIPVISDFSPKAGPVGTHITITGDHFDPISQNNIVYFGAVRASVVAASETMIEAVAPMGANYKQITITTNGLTAYSALPFTISFPDGGAVTNSSFTPKIDFETGEAPYNVITGDFDADGKPDLAFANYYPNTVSVYRNTSTVGGIALANRVDFGTATNPIGVAGGDLDGDGRIDLVSVNRYGNNVSVLCNTSTAGNVTFAERLDFPVGTNPYGVAVGDVDNDGKPDVVAVNNSSNTVSVLRNTSTGGSLTFGSKVDFAAGNNPYWVEMADLDGDGRQDLVVSNRPDNTVSIFLNTSTQGNIQFASKIDLSTGVNPHGIAIGDFDGDGKLDLIVTNSTSFTFSVFRNLSTSGNLAFTAKTDFSTGISPVIYMSSIGDIDGDGRPDLAIANNGGNSVSVFRNNSAGGSILFAPRVDFGAGGNPHGTAVVDLDGDGKPDLAVGNNSSNTISILRNLVNAPPLAPQALVATAGDGSVALKWDKNIESDFLRYRIYGGTSPNPTTKIDSTTGGAVDTTKTVLGLTNGTTYYFRVTAVDNSGNESGYSNEVTAMPKDTVETPAFNPTPGIYNAAQDVTIGCATAGAVIHYTINGVDPTESDPIFANPIHIAATTTLKARAFKTGWEPSAVASGTYTINQPQNLTGEYISDANTVLLMHMNEASGTTVSDASSFGNNGTATGTTVVDGKFGKARNFTSVTDYITVLHSSSLAPSLMTLEAWVNPVTINHSRYVNILRKQGSSDFYLLAFQEYGTILSFGAKISGSYAELDIPINRADYEGKWTHIAATFDGSSKRVYRNGVLIGSTNITGTLVQTGGELWIGAQMSSEPFKGIIEEIRISNIARSPQEFDLQLPPQNLSANANGTVINLSWQNGGGAVPLQYYKIYRWTDSTNVALVDSTASASYANSGLSAGTEYFYRISTVDLTGFESVKSYAARATTGSTNIVITPNFNPLPGLYTTAKDVSISCAMPEAVIHYTTNGVDPTESDPIFTNPIHIATTTTLKAKAFKAGWDPSVVVSGTYTINRPPIANAGPDQTIQAVSAAGASVTLDGTGSSDPDGDPLTFSWSGSFGTATGSTPTVQVPLGSNVIVLTVQDSVGAVATDTVMVHVPGFIISANPGSQSINSGSSTSYVVSVNSLAQYNLPVTISVNVPTPDISIKSITPNPVTPSGTVILTVDTRPNTPLGNYQLTITAISGPITQTTPVTLVVTNTPQPGDFNLMASPISQGVIQGPAVVLTEVDLLAMNGFSDPVNLSVVDGLPPGATVSFSPNPMVPPGSIVAQMSVSIGSSTPAGSYPLVVTGCSGAIVRSATSTLNVVAPPSTGGNTPVSDGLITIPVGSGVSIGFASVLAQGTTSVTVTSQGPPPPAGFKFAGSYYEISTDASVVSPITVIFHYADSRNETTYRLLHRENNKWVDITCPGYPDTSANVIAGRTSSFSLFVIAETNRPPLAEAGPDQTVECMSPAGVQVTLNGSGSVDPESGALTFTWKEGGNLLAGPTSNTTAVVTLAFGNHKIHLIADDGNGGIGIDSVLIQIVDTKPPVVTEITAPLDPVRVNTSISASASFTDQWGTHTAAWNWGDGNTSPGTVLETNGSGTVAGSHTYATAGVYTLKLSLTDQSQNSAEAFFQYVVVFNPDAGFVTGGGWIQSPAGAYPANPTLTGKANFGFVSKYQKGANVPTGDTQFQFKTAGLNFKSASYEWLVIAGGKSKYKGSGTINNAGDYGFMLTATDGQWKNGTGLDKFRIKIWQKDASETVVYDNQMGASDDADATMEIGGGSIVVHSEGLAKSASPDGEEEAELLAETPKSFTLFQNFPNPFNPETTIRFALPEDRRVEIRIFTVYGKEIRLLAGNEYKAGIHAVLWDGRDMQGNPVASGIYLCRIKAGEFISINKMILCK